MANKSVRSSQLLSPFGIGQIINFPKEVSVMVCGLNLWDEKIQQRKIQAGYQNIDEVALRIIEPRLQKVLGVEYFIKPFSYHTSGIKNNFLTIPVVRFPRWHHCTNHLCGSMREVELTFAEEKIECDICGKSGNKFKSKMIPVRFVAACSNGHIQDVPFKEWVHDGSLPNDDKNHNLSYHSLSGSGDLGSILIKCSCGEKRTLAGLMNVRKNGDKVFDSALARIGLDKEEDKKFTEDEPNDNNPLGQYCKGHRPWLGVEGIIDAKPCAGKKHLQVLIRGASNVHFSDIVSAIYLPQVSSQANEYVVKVIEEKGRDELKKYYNLDKGTIILPAILSSEAVIKNNLISKDELVAGVIAEILENEILDEINNFSSEEGLRLEEYQYILEGRNSENADFKAIKKKFDEYSEKDFLEKYFECVVLIEKLKETRVFRSFARIDPGNKTDISELSNENVNWLPATEVFGEGIFLKFRDDVIDKWLESQGDSFTNIIDRYHGAMLKRRPTENLKKVNASFIVMHTFTHLLIKKLCFHCGYGSSSLRERLYFNDDDDNRMNGILIYTSSGDSEGSLGGLVRQGKANNLGKLVKDSIEDARWCSADPVCSDIGQSSGQGPDNVNGSACHNCSIVPETSCEEFNMLLDRASIIGTFENPSIGFFN
ncbi:DUF1998 domain-containing protein [Flavobacterium sp. 102]|uniref:DUF1998 domain-containing protein n=1 Tax=Flavobacterium sp. 102 TaxID=2135623 RepID=UPI000F17B2B9|nr:DUF1998 domain-containing protein [Flavobacterium sp. 102]RKS01698.1 uncharacterized protein DUF1998 [Flavobacterium sp. 102]